MEKLLHLGYVTISYMRVENCLVQTWHSFCSEKDFISIQEKSAEFIEENKCRAFVCDCVNAAPLQVDAIKWYVYVLVPRLKGAGISVVEVVQPRSACTHITIEYIERKIGSFMRVHQTVEQALNTVRSVKSS